MSQQRFQQVLSKLRWLAFRGFDSLGLLGRTSIVMSLLAIMLSVWLLLPLKQSIQQRQIDIQVASVHELQTAQPVLDEKKMLTEYLEQFADTKQREQQINRIVALARQNGILLHQVTYKNNVYEINSNSRLSKKTTQGTSHTNLRSATDFVQTLMEFSVRESYQQVHQFLNAILVTMPTVAIDTLRFSRLETDDDAIDVNIRLIFYFKRP